MSVLTRLFTPRPAAREDRRARLLSRLQARGTLLPPTILFAFGLAHCLYLGQWLEVPWQHALLWAGGAAVAFSLILYSRYTAIGVLLTCALAALILRRNLEPQQIEEAYLFLSEQLAYVRLFLFEGEPFDAQYSAALFSAIALTCGLLAAVLCFRLRSALAMTLLSLGVLALEWNISRDVVLPSLWPLAIACVLVLSMRGFRFAALSPLQSTAAALAISLTAGGFCALAVPTDTAGVRFWAIERMVDDVNDLLSEYTGFQRGHSSFSIAWVGYQPLGDRLGGAVTLPDDEILRVNTVSPRLLRGAVRNYYTGYSWTRSASVRTYRLGNPLITGKQEEILGVEIPALGEIENRFARETEIYVTHLANMSSTLFTAGRVRSLRPADNRLIPNFDENGETFAKRAVPMFGSYIVSARVPQADSRPFSQTIEEIYQSELLYETDPEIEDRNAFLYLGLPEELPASVRELSRRLTEGGEASTDYEKALAIRDYLRENMTYTLSPADPPEGADFVEHFLQTKEGYCTYYASAMAVMARAIGLPSRYAEGFLLEGSTRTENGYIVQADQAHAWAEVYIEGIGWLPFDATPLRRTESSAGSDVYSMPEPTPEPSQESGDEFIPIDPLSTALSVPWWAYVTVLAVALTVVFFTLLRRHERRWSMDRLEIRYPEPIELLNILWRDSLRILELIGMPIATGETALTYAARVDESVQNPEGRLTSVAMALCRARYGSFSPGAEELYRAQAYHGELDLQLLKSLGRVRYLFLRALRSMPSRAAGRVEPHSDPAARAS